MTNREFYAKLYTLNPELTHDLIGSGGLRTIFDYLSSEWGNTTQDEKIGYVEKIVQSGIDVTSAMFAAADDIKEHGYGEEHACHVVSDSAIRVLSHHLGLTV